MEHKKSILNKYAEHLINKYEDWDVEVVHRVSNGTAGVWGIIQLSKIGENSILLRVRPRYGVDRVRFKGNHFFKEKTVLTKQQLQLQFGFAPTARALTKELFPYSDIREEDLIVPVGGNIFET